MRHSLMRFLHAVFVVLFLFLVPMAKAQVVAGIKANGITYNQGDTINVCKGSKIHYESAASGSLVIQWKFNSGNPGAASGIGPFDITYNTTGYDTTFQRVDGSNGFSDSAFVIVRISDDKPAAAYNFAPDNVCGNIPIQFTNSSTGQAPLSYLWSFNDGDTSSASDPAHQFLTAVGVSGTQTFNVKLVVTNALACKDSISKAVTIIKVPDASIGNGGAPAISFGTFNGLATFKHCATDLYYPFQFTNASTTNTVNVSYTIKWGDGTPDSTFASWPTAAIITHTFPRGGSNMEVQVTGTNGCIGIKKYNVFLGTNPAGGLASLGNTDICSSESLTFNVTGVSNNPPGTQYIFSTNDGTPSQAFLHPPPTSVSHYFITGSCGVISSNGSVSYSNSYAAYLLITNPCGSTSPAVVPIYVSGKPKPAIYIPAPVVCVNTNVLVQSLSSFGNVVSSTGSTTSSCINTGKIVWEISPSTYTLASGSLGSFNGNPGNGALWTSGSQSMYVNFTAEGVYTIRLTLYNDRCGYVTSFTTICVRNPPQASFTMSQKKSCGTATVDFTNTSPAGGCKGNAYLWDITYTDPLNCSSGTGASYTFANGSTSASTSPSITFNKAGRYIIRLTTSAVNGYNYYCQPAVAYDTFYLTGPPAPTLSGVADICVNNSINPSATVASCYGTGPLTYQWTFTGGTPASSTDLSPGAVSYTATGSYQVQLVVADAGCNQTGTITKTITVGNRPTAEAGNNASICSGASVQIGAVAANGVTYKWSPANGVSNPNIANPNFSIVYDGPSADTTYKLFVTAAQGSDCSSIDSVEITVKKKPVLTVNPASVTLCATDSVQLTAAGAISYLWSPAGSLNNNNTDTVVAKPSATATYTVTGTGTNGCTDSKTIPVAINGAAKAQFTANATTLCAPVNLNTIITTTPYPLLNGTYNWYADDVPIGSSASPAFPSYSMTNPGDTIIIKLVAKSSAGCKADSMQMTFITRPSIAASFTKDKDSSCAPLVVAFANTSPAYANTQYNWNFGNGITSTLANPLPVNFAPSPNFRDTVYYITLTANSGCAGSVKKDSVKVFANAQARFGVNSVTGCSPFTATFTNTSRGNNTAYYWDFGDGQTFTTANSAPPITHLYTTGVISTYKVQLIAENKCAKDTQSINLLVTPSTIQPFVEANGNQLSGCAPHTVTFNNGSAGAAQLTWNFGDGTPLVVTPYEQAAVTHTYQSSGNFIVTIRLQNSCSDTTIKRSISVYPKPVAGFTVLTPLVCPGTLVKTSNTSQNADSYQWLWGDGNTSNDINAQHSYAAPGTFTITQVAYKINPSGFICTDTVRNTVTITGKIPAAISAQPVNVLCAPYNYTASAINAANASLIEWFVINTATQQQVYYSTGISMAHALDDGTYKIKLLVHTTTDCTDSTELSATVYKKPTVTIAPTGAATCNHDTTIVFTATPSYNGTDALQYNWFINGELQDAGNPWAHRFNLPLQAPETIFNVQGLAKNAQGCGDTSVASRVIIYAIPVPIIQVTPANVLIQPDYTFGFHDLAAADPDKFYTWDMGDKTLTQRNGKDITYQYGDTGSYKVRLLVVNHRTGCSAKDSVNVQILYVGGYLYVPNAMCMGCANNALRRFLPLGKGLKTYRLRIYNTWGQVIFETTKLTADGSPDEAWNGTMNGKPLQQDTYTWQIEARFKNGTEWKGMMYPGASNPVKAGFIDVIK